ncbi:MAG: hypothetical protein ACJAYE_003704 [Candidatus Azotimanducaceae bacterium]|jgi:hypothetical protein
MIIAFLLLAHVSASATELQNSEASGRALMQQVYDTHQQYPYVYEEQSMVLIDREGNRETRKVKLYSRVESNLLQRILLLFDSPKDVKGVAVLAERNADGETRQAIYLPALGRGMIENSGESGDANFLGTDFSVENLTGERLEDYIYRRRRDELINDKMYSVIDVFGKEADAEQTALRRHFISQENFYLTRTDYFDGLGRVRKRQSSHDMAQVLGNMWRANMMLMENLQNDHQTLIKVDRRVFSKDYVPSEVFTTEYLYANSHAEGLIPDDLPDEAAEAELTGELEGELAP